MPRPGPVPQREARERLDAAALDAHPIPTLVVDDGLRVLAANAAARRLLGAAAGALLGDALGCVDSRSPAGCGQGEWCGGCAFRRAAERALAGERVRERGFVIRGDRAPGQGDVHMLASASPLRVDARPLAILALTDVNALLADPKILRVCEGCGRVQDEDGEWHPLHRYFADHLGLEGQGPLCDACATGR